MASRNMTARQRIEALAGQQQGAVQDAMPGFFGRMFMPSGDKMALLNQMQEADATTALANEMAAIDALNQQQVENVAPAMASLAAVQGVGYPGGAAANVGLARQAETMARGGVSAESGAAAFANNPAMNPRLAEALRMQEMAAAEQQMGRWGSGLDYSQFQTLNNAVNTYSKGIGNARFVSDVVSQTTPAQLMSPAMANVRGKLKTTMFELYRPIQALSESKESVLREGERQAIDDYLANPDGFFSQLMSFDEVTVGKMQKLEAALQRNREAALVGLDDRTLGLLGDSMNIPTSPFTPPGMDESSIRDPQLRPMTKQEQEQLQSGFEAMRGVPVF